MKRKISIMLALSLLLTSISPAFAEESAQKVDNQTVITETAEKDDDDVTLSTGSENDDEPKEEKSNETENENPTDESDDFNVPVIPEEEPAEPLPEVETTLSEDETYKLNVILFSLKESVSLGSVESDLTEMGLTEITPVFTDEDGNPKPMGSKKEVWYRAYTKADANQITADITKVDGVTYAEPEYIYTADSIGEPEEVETSKGWIYDSLLKIKSDFWWYTALNHDFAPGKDTVVAVIDTGVDYTHEDLAANMWVNTAELYGTPGVDDDGDGYIDDIYGVDVTVSGQKAGNPMDDNGHGTHVAGIIGMSANGIGGVGLAYGSKIMAIKAGQSTGTFSSSNIAKAIDYAHMMGADVINMSFGGTMKSYLIETALEDAFADCVLVASAGNNGMPTTDAPASYIQKEDVYPAGYSYVLGVMATDKSGRMASFSNWDYTPNANCEYELTAPGVDIYSTLPNNRYAKWNGTSMAAPCVSAAAAIIRSNYSDKDMYSARFIMGQLASATKSRTNFVAQMGESYSYPALNIYDSINYLPKPNLSVKDTFLMDSKDIDPANDGDAIIDAGETIDLGVLVRNQWGLTGDITVKADAVSVGGVANPYIEFITDEVTLQPAGTFQEVNNGFVYDDSLLVGIDNPIRFKVSPETPNDAEICVNITVTTTNVADSKDKDIYTTAEPVKHTFRVQAGKGISGTLTEDTTLTNDYLWVIENSLYIPEGITLTIEPGTKVQFYSSDYEDAYGGKTIANINCAGTLNAIGTEDEPIEMYPGAGFENLCVEIAGDGAEMLKYCNIINPKLGVKNSDTQSPISIIDHCVLTQKTAEVDYRHLTNDGDVYQTYFQWAISATTISNSQLSGFYNGYGKILVVATYITQCIFNNCKISLSENDGDDLITCQESLYLAGTSIGGSTIKQRSVTKNGTIEYENKTYTYDGAKSKYIKINFNDMYPFAVPYECSRYIAKKLGGSLVCINDDFEKEFVTSTIRHTFIGVHFNLQNNRFEWDDGTAFEYDIVSESDSFLLSRYIRVDNNRFIRSRTVGNMLIEIPKEKRDEEIFEILQNFDYNEFIKQYNNSFSCNAVLNPVLNNNTDLWTKIIASSFDSESTTPSMPDNYWGTENKTLIKKMIIDADDFPGQYQDIIEDPILTLDSPSLAEIYPFVTKVYLTDNDGNIISNVTSGETYNVHVLFNRDMDTETQPTVTYGGDAPYTDYSVNGDFVSAREWVGTTKISPVLTGGTMYWRTKGGCAADDKWLVCGEDVLRFCFTIGTSGTLAMLLNAEGGANKVDLSWAQNDYETLAGYNIYRSEKADSGFKKINLSVVTDTSYTDTDVKPGVTYYYYFKVVNTDGNEESSVSNTASTAPIDNIFPVLKHTPVETAKAGAQITISATATDNIGVESVKLYYRKSGTENFTEKKMTGSNNLYVAVIPASIVTAEGVEYYVTASDADGNVSYSGTAQLPNVITINSEAYISGITPSTVAISGGRTVSILGGNFTEDMTLTVGGVEITEKSFIDQGQINFVAPAMASGSYAVTLTTTDGKTVTAKDSLSYTDASSMAQIPTTMTMTSGVAYTIPFYATASGDIISVHAELDLPSADFTSVKVEKANADANFTLDYTYSGGVLKIGCIGTSNINTADSALLNIIVMPKVTEDKQYTVNLHDVSFNGVKVSNVISGEAHIKTSYVFDAIVKYFVGTDNFVKNVTVSASGVKAVTDGNGKATLTVPAKNVVISAQRTLAANAVTAYDASLVLQSAIGKTVLNDNQKKAADVDGNGEINEYDAALILQKSVRKIDTFPASYTWLFVPSSIEKTLSTSGTDSVSFTAISLGDVDGSFEGDSE